MREWWPRERGGIGAGHLGRGYADSAEVVMEAGEAGEAHKVLYIKLWKLVVG
jgi:hypothetical protein